MRVALLQLDIAWEDRTENHARASRLLERAAREGAELAVLPEMFATGFSMDAERVAEPPGGATETWLKGMAGDLGLHLIAGVAETGSPHPFNNALHVTPAGEVERFSKLHPFSFAREERSFGSGRSVVTWTVRGARVTPFVCYDLRFPEPFRLAAADTDAFVVIANWPDRRSEHWRTLLRARAVENLAFVLGVNRVGDGGGLHYAGQSAAISPWGETLLEAVEIETVLVVDIDPAAVAEARTTFPVLADRKPSYERSP